MDVLGRPLAQWWRRLVALLVDLVGGGFVAVVVATAVTRPSAASLRGGGYRVHWSTGTLTATLLAFLLLTAYLTFMNGSRRGQTLGKMM
ncbi:MAG: RDD family protein, partial [Acidimicrobiales bacterium]